MMDTGGGETFTYRYDPVYAKQLTINKGVDNVLLFEFINQEEKPVNITGSTFVFRVINTESNELLLQKPMTILNAATGRGRHTSSSAIALPLVDSDGWIIDTPGIRAFGLSHIDSQRIVDAFSDLSEVAANCLSNCSHAESTCKLDAWAAPDGVPNPHRTARLASLRSLLAVKEVPYSAVDEDPQP